MIEAPSVLCLHGFTGSPAEIRPLADTLARGGCLVEAPLLPGHGSDTAALAGTGWPDWESAAHRALTGLVARAGGPVAIVGASMGGLLAIRLAAARPDAVAALVLMGVPLPFGWLRGGAVRLLSRALATTRLGARAALPKTGGVDVCDPAARAAAGALSWYPLQSLASLVDLTAAADRDMEAILAPTLVVHGRLDRTVPIRRSMALAGRLRAAPVERLWLDRSGHVVALDFDGRELADAVTSFLARYASRPRAATTA